jgi:CheY-like chemotaxis protein
VQANAFLKPEGKLILLAEDDPNDVLLFERALAKTALSQTTLQVVNDGEAALAYLSGQEPYLARERYPLPALILLDLKMPRKSGLEVLAWLREQPGLKYVPSVVLTSSKQTNDVERAYQLGANSYLVKPVVLADLVKLIQNAASYWLVLNNTP